MEEKDKKCSECPCSKCDSCKPKEDSKEDSKESNNNQRRMNLND